jgi:hypothetical protein
VSECEELESRGQRAGGATDRFVLALLAAFRLAVAVYFALACAVSVAADLARVELRPDGDRWQATLTWPQPATRVEFLRNPQPRSERGWRVLDAGFVLDRCDARDCVQRADGSAFTAVTLEVPARFVPYADDYAPFSPFGDGAQLIHSGQFHACAAAGATCQGRWRFLAHAPAGQRIVVRGRVHEAMASWEDSGDGTMVYVGNGALLRTPHLIAVVDERFPSGVRTSLLDLLPRLLAFYAARLDTTLVQRPMLFASYDARDTGGRFGSKGGTLDAQVFMHLYGGAWEDEGRRAALRDWLPWFFAHEAAHLYQMHKRSRDPALAWIHEGAAEAFALLALRELRLAPAPSLQARIESGSKRCAEALRETPLVEAHKHGRFDAHYSCGLSIQMALDAAIRARGRGDLFALWRAFLAGQRAGLPWSAHSFLSAAEPLAGAACVRSIADALTARGGIDPELCRSFGKEPRS